jgi:hypothetical protein
MYTAYQLALCERIREHCRQRNWYGSDYHFAARLAHSLLDEQVTTGFLNAPATESRLDEAERALGFALPPALRAVYTHVADGGFGPATGLLDAASLARTLTQGSWQISDRAVARLDQDPRAQLYCEDEPAGLVTLCAWDEFHGLQWDGFYGLHSKLDSRTGRVVVVIYDMYPPEPHWDSAIVIEPQARSIEDWFERWMVGELLPYAAANDLDVEREEQEYAVSLEPEFPDSEPSDADWARYFQRARPKYML